MADYGVILTFSTGQSVRAEKVLTQAGIETKMIPVPRHLSSDCGVAVRIRQRDREQALKILARESVSFDRYEPLQDSRSADDDRTYGDDG